MQKYIAEFLGTLVFLTVIAKSDGTAWKIVMGLLGAILLMGDVSGGHFNPAVSFMMMLNGKLDNTGFVMYVASQLLGGAAAIQLAKFHL